MKEKIYLQSGVGNDKAEIDVDIYITENNLKNNSFRETLTILMVPGAGGKNYPTYQKVYEDLAIDLVNNGFCAITFSPRGHSGSGGLYSHKNVLEDITSVSQYIKNNNYGKDTILFGRSAGAGISAQYAINNPEIKGIALWGGPPRIDAWFTLEKRADTFHNFTKRGTNFDEDRFLNSIINLEEVIEHVKSPFLLFAGSDDEYTSQTEQFNLWLKVSSTQSMFTIIKGAKHALDSSHAQYKEYRDLLVYWIKVNFT